MQDRGWGWTASRIRQARLIEWLAPQSSSATYVSVKPFYDAQPDQEAVTIQVVHDELWDLQQRSVIDLAAGVGGIESYDAKATAAGRRLAEELRALRADKRRRKAACRDAMVDWLYARDAISPLTQPARDEMLADPHWGTWLAEPFSVGDLDTAAAWLSRHHLVGGLTVDECDGPVRLYLTEAGVTCVEEFDSDTTRYIAAQRPSRADLSVDRSAGTQVGAGNVQVNHFYGNESPLPDRLTASASTVPSWQGGSQEPAGTANDLDGLYLRAIDQLGSGQETVRIGALHALNRLGQNSPSLRKAIIDVICAYLRMPYNEPDESVVGDPAVQTTLRKELQVRLAAQSIVADHLRDDIYRGQRHDSLVPETFWPEIDLVDLRGAYLIDLDLSGCRITGIECRGAIFIGGSLFRGLICDLAFFQKAVFKGLADFRGAVFTNSAWFSWSAFAGDVWFHGDGFFPPARFGRHAGFKQATFAHKARFEQVIFEGSADYEAITCKAGSAAINLSGCQVLRPDAVNPDVSKEPSTWPPGWHIEPCHDGTATITWRD
jgi:predicted RNA methylase